MVSLRFLGGLATGLLLACGGSRPGTPPAPAAAQSASAHILNTPALAGQQIPVLPITMVVAEPGLAGDSVYAALRDRRTALLWTDSLIADGLLAHASEVNWIFPPQLRKVARRSPGVVPDPDQMGQSVMRNPRLDRAPDQLAAGLRGLIAVAGGRQVLIPAALGFGRTESGAIQADLSLVLLDGRGNRVLWRTRAEGRGATPAEALQAALAAALPTEVTE